ncbi:hypothetical protein ANCDUO_10501 [Ancylostoma duodenale]|uniref:tRNA (32-2'-O)-methyltransferase regulator THADA n=1 Tax=Ancylostoma duodenale TaxID=51022 RepID=A0A0C2GQK8_9BILA|nr:hypothetical protein ANCDUO_10501 [Ancylostoma duodenale]
MLSDIISFDLEEFPDRWGDHINNILTCLSSESNNVRSAIKDRLLPKLVRTKILKDEFLPLVLDNMKERPLHLHCLDSLLSITRFLVLSNKKCDSYKYWYDYIPLKTMRYAVLHWNVQVRLAAWLLLSEHPQRTHTLSQNDLDLIRAFILTNMTEQSPAIRQKILAGLRKILARMAETSEQVLKGKDGDVERVKLYNDFISLDLLLISVSLFPFCSFLLSLAFDSLSSGANFSRRMMALSIIQCMLVEDSLKANGKTLFLEQLNLSNIVTSERFRSLLACLDDSFQLCQIMALDILKKIRTDESFVTPAVHSMSPEGYIPEETLNEMANSLNLDSKVQVAAEVSQLLLVCCWRAHKHISAILAWAVVKLCPFSMLTPVDVHRIGAYYWLQLTECKHCGAFESAVDGFSALCAYLWKCDDAALPKPSDWLRQILGALEGRRDLEKLCSTRRSAGVPHLVTAILTTEPPGHPNESMNVAMRSLLEMRNKGMIYRVHSLNVLKAIFSSAALGERVTPALEVEFLPDILNEFSVYPSLIFLTHLFPSNVGVTATVKADGDSKSVRDFSLAPFVPVLIRVLLWCRAEKLRKLTAAALIAISRPKDIAFVLDWIDGVDLKNVVYNHIHAVLLLVSLMLVK